MILTHKHEDHMGQVNQLLEDIQIQQVMVPYHFDEINYQQYVLKKYDRFQCGIVELEVINANHHDQNENNNSIVLLAKIHDEYWLFAADIEVIIENELLKDMDVKINHLKVAHHGSMTSSSKAFLEQIKVENAYISYGYNHYGMPSDVIIDRLHKMGAKIYTTYDQGSIEIVYCQSYRWNIFYKDGRKSYHFN